jgi:hypothetical protein
MDEFPTYGERGFMRGRVTTEDLPPEPKVVAKNKLIEFATKERQLSWSVGRFSGRDRWPLMYYQVQHSPGIPGALVVTDDDTDADIMVYAKAGTDWHSVALEYYWRGEWHLFRPQEALQEWKSGDLCWVDAEGMPEEVTW